MFVQDYFWRALARAIFLYSWRSAILKRYDQVVLQLVKVWEKKP